jgi:hypothetical protein
VIVLVFKMERGNMLKRAWLSLSLLLIVSLVEISYAEESIAFALPVQGEQETTAVVDQSNGIILEPSAAGTQTKISESDVTKIVKDGVPFNVDQNNKAGASDVVGKQEDLSRFGAALKGVKELPNALQDKLVKCFDGSLGRLSPNALKDRNALKAALFAGVSIATLYVGYRVWKKYFANKSQEDEDQCAPFCQAARSPKK